MKVWVLEITQGEYSEKFNWLHGIYRTELALLKEMQSFGFDVTRVVERDGHGGEAVHYEMTDKNEPNMYSGDARYFVGFEMEVQG